MEKPPDAIRVEIYDQEYYMRSNLDPEYVHQLASFLDGKMRAVASHTRTVDTLRVAVLAAMNIADEFHQIKAQYEAKNKQLDQRVNEFSEVIDQLLKQLV